MCSSLLPGVKPKGKVHLTDNPVDLDVITTGWERTVQSVRAGAQQAAVRECNRGERALGSCL